MNSNRHIFQTCAKRLAKVSAKQVPTETTYEQVWEAMILWLKEQFASCRGGSMQTFGKLLWLYVKQSDGSQLIQPVFTLNDSYVKANMLQLSASITRAATLVGAELQPCEEMNFSKVALRYSNSLNKDTVFTCMRHLLSVLGDSMRTGMSLVVDFGIGTLRCKERKVEFVFLPEYHTRSPPASSRPLPARGTSAGSSRALGSAGSRRSMARPATAMVSSQEQAPDSGDVSSMTDHRPSLQESQISPGRGHGAVKASSIGSTAHGPLVSSSSPEPRTLQPPEPHNSYVDVDATADQGSPAWHSDVHARGCHNGGGSPATATDSVPESPGQSQAGSWSARPAQPEPDFTAGDACSRPSAPCQQALQDATAYPRCESSEACPSLLARCHSSHSAAPSTASSSGRALVYLTAEQRAAAERARQAAHEAAMMSAINQNLESLNRKAEQTKLANKQKHRELQDFNLQACRAKQERERQELLSIRSYVPRPTLATDQQQIEVARKAQARAHREQLEGQIAERQRTKDAMHAQDVMTDFLVMKEAEYDLVMSKQEERQQSVWQAVKLRSDWRQQVIEKKIGQVAL